MKMAKVLVCCGLLLGGWLAGPVLGQEASPPGVARVSAPLIGYVPSNNLGTYLRYRGDVGDGLGWDGGFNTISAFQPLTIIPDQDLFFADLRGNASYTGDLFANIGVGYRHYSRDLGYVFGAAAWYDHDETGKRSFDQGGISLEALGTYLDFRANAYLPNTNPFAVQRDFAGTIFQGNSLVLRDRQVFETAMSGGDVETGGALPFLGDLGIRAYSGMYYYTGESEDSTIGMKGRIEALITEDFAIQANVTHDHLFGTHVGGALTWLLGSGKPQRILTRQPQVNRLYVQQERTWRVARHRRQAFVDTTAVNTATGANLAIFHVDNTAAAGGTGTAEAPLNFLPATVAPSDVIFVHTGDGTGNNLGGGITLMNNQKLFGEGVPHFVNTTQGTFQLPGSTNGSLPLLTGNAVTLANNNTVDGFRMAASTTASIQGTNITDFDLRNIHVLNGETTGFLLTNAVGTGRITNSTFNGVINDNIRVRNTMVSPLDLTVTNVTTTDGLNGMHLIANGSSIITGINNSLFRTAAQDGVQGSSVNNGTLGLTVTDSVFADNTRRGIDMFLDPSTGTLITLNSQFLNNGSDGVRATVIDNSTFTGNLQSSIFATNGGEGAMVNASNSIVNLSSSLSTYLNNGHSGVNTVFSGSFATVNFDQNLLQGNGFDGFRTTTGGNQLLAGVPNSYVFTRNVFTSNANGLTFDRRDNSQFSAVIGNGPGQSEMGNRFELNTDAGLKVSATGTDLTNALLVDDNRFAQNNNGATYFLAGDSAVVTTHHRNQYLSNTNDGVFATTLNSSQFGLPGSFSSFGSELFQANGQNGIELVVNNPSIETNVTRLAFQNVVVEGIDNRTQFIGGRRALLIRDASNALVANTFQVRQTDINMLGGGVDGILYSGTGTATSTLQIGSETVGENVTIANAGDDGIDIRVTRGTKFLNILGNSTPGANSATVITNSGVVTNNGNTDATRGDGITIIQQGGVVVANIFGVQSVNNAGRGLTADIRSTTGTQTYNIGSFVQGNAALNASRQNVFSNNRLQGTVVQTVFQGIEGAFALLLDDAPGSDPTDIIYPDNYLYLNTGSIDFVEANVNYENNVTQFNGSVFTPVDGAVFAASTNSAMNLAINANTFGGNQLSDVYITVLRASVPDTADTILSTNDAISGPPIRDQVFYDPVAHMNVAFGVFDNAGSNTPETQRGSTGNQIRVNTFGVASTYLGSDLIGVFRTEDNTNTGPPALAFRSAGRAAVGFFNVYNAGLLNGPLPGNQFEQTGVLQNIQATFGNANRATAQGNTITFFPPNTVFPFPID